MNLPQTITGTVQHGNEIARRFGTPTANITAFEDVSALERGVYYSDITIDGRTYHSITNLGVRPTVSSSGRVNAETFIYDLDDDIYGKRVSVTLLDFRRPEKKFASTAQLFETVKDDLLAGRAYHGI